MNLRACLAASEFAASIFVIHGRCYFCRIPARLLVLVSLAAALASDWLREERVVFPAPLPKFTTVPKPR